MTDLACAFAVAVAFSLGAWNGWAWREIVDRGAARIDGKA